MSNIKTHKQNTRTHLVEKRDGGLQDLLPLAELSLVKLPLKLQDLSPLSSCLGQRTEERKVEDGKGENKKRAELFKLVTV